MDCDIQFLGDLKNKDLQEAYQNADIFALTSMPIAKSVEGFHQFVYLEASAHGLPILAHKIGGVHIAVLDGKTGILCAPDKPELLLENLQKLIEQHETKEKLWELLVLSGLGSTGGEISHKSCTSFPKD